MEDAFKAYFSSFLLLLALLSSLKAFATVTDIEYVSPSTSASLAHQFADAHLPNQLSGSWTCDMYGMRSHMRVKRGVNLYRWSGTKEIWNNNGAQPVSSYRTQDGSLTGVSQSLPTKVIDRVRITRKGQLISELSLASSPKTILAYSICTAP